MLKFAKAVNGSAATNAISLELRTPLRARSATTRAEGASRAKSSCNTEHAKA